MEQPTAVPALTLPTNINREGWLTSAGNAILSRIILPRVTASNILEGKGWAVACGWPSTRALSRGNRRMGECWTKESCADGTTYHIFISPYRSEPVQDNGEGVLPDLTHELIHAVVGTAEGHKGLFKKVARAVGLEGRLTSTHAGDELAYYLKLLAEELGPYPHARLDSRGRPGKVQSTRMRKVVCSSCGYTIRVAQSWISVGLPTCHCGEVMVA